MAIKQGVERYKADASEGINSGSYRLHILVNREVELKIGALGNFPFPAGYYIYSGSAMRNLKQRLERHIRLEKSLKWHIDYLLSANNVKIIGIDEFPSENREECIRNSSLLKLPTARIVAPKFGSSDCKCVSHLIYFGLKKITIS